jgi:hypothetical protein
MDTRPEFLEELWNDLLSRQAELIIAAFDKLDESSQKTVFAHLQHMAHDMGWHPEQRKSASVALQVLENRFHQEK